MLSSRGIPLCRVRCCCCCCLLPLSLYTLDRFYRGSSLLDVAVCVSGRTYRYTARVDLITPRVNSRPWSALIVQWLFCAPSRPSWILEGVAEIRIVQPVCYSSFYILLSGTSVSLILEYSCFRRLFVCRVMQSSVSIHILYGSIIRK